VVNRVRFFGFSRRRSLSYAALGHSSAHLGRPRALWKDNCGGMLASRPVVTRRAGGTTEELIEDKVSGIFTAWGKYSAVRDTN
jgi:hypothetical protein